MIAAMQLDAVPVSAQEKWTKADLFSREKMLTLIGWSGSFAPLPWKKLKHMIKVNLSSKSWTM